MPNWEPGFTTKGPFQRANSLEAQSDIRILYYPKLTYLYIPRYHTDNAETTSRGPIVVDTLAT